MAKDVEVIDADGHITETDTQLKKYMESPWVDRTSTLYPIDNWDRSIGGTLGTRAADAKTWLNAMDEGGLTTAYLYPTGGLGIGWIREPDLAVSLCKAWNDFVSEESLEMSQ